MAAIAQSLPAANRPLAWLREWLREELAPYPGRGLRVARMVLASTLVMIITMTWSLSYGAYAALYALNISRDSLEGTKRAVQSIMMGFLLAGAYIIPGAMIAIADPLVRFLWIVTTLFLVFWGGSATGNLGAWNRFGYMAVISISLWDRHITAQAKLDGVLRAIGVLTMASVIVLLLEVVWAAMRRGDDLMDPITERLGYVENILRCYANGRPVDAATQSNITRLAMFGTSRIRSLLTRSNKGPQYVQEMGAVVALTGRLVDLTANLPHFAGQVSDVHRYRIGRVADHIAGVRHELENNLVPRAVQADEAIEEWPGLPLLGEIELTVSRIREIFAGSQSLRIFDPAAPELGGRQRVFGRGVLFNAEHLKFGLRGCLAASLCYIIYTALAWPELSTSVTTCFLTASNTIGASRQKQVLRIGGALIGGVGIGMGAQIFILPSIDSIAGFTILFVLVTVIAAWIATASPRLSYLGVQVAFAFYVINLQEFTIQTSLTVARDRVIGILLALLVMWLVFDQLWSAPAGVEMKKTSVATLRLLAQFAREPLSKDLRTAIECSYSLREKINAQFDKVRSLADVILFEFGPTRKQDLELRSRVRGWQPELRALFVMRIASWKYRAQVPGFEFPESVLVRQADYDERSARILEDRAVRIEDVRPAMAGAVDDSSELLQRAIEETQAEESRGLAAGRAQSFVTLLRGIDGLTRSLASRVAAEFSGRVEDS